MLDRLEKALSDKYEIERELGRGGMATVYLAQDKKHDRSVALKVLHPELSSSLGPDRFLREIKVAARLNHPHILPLHDSGEADGFLYYVMPYVEGESLRTRLNRAGKLPLDEALYLARGIAGALDYAHRQRVVHRDIKPENIMLHEGEAMVMDFGIAKAVSAAAGDTLTQTGMMVGTPAYVSPEQAAGEAEIDGRSDQYSLACMLFEVLTGKKAFAGSTTQAVLSKRFTDPVPSLRNVDPTVPDEIDEAVGKAMAKEPRERYNTSGEFAKALVWPKVSTPADQTTVKAQAPAPKSIAVLPFADMSAERENGYFTDGMAEEIINALTTIKALRVASRTSSFAFKATTEDIRQVGKKLDVATVLEGSVRKAGNKLRITAQLVNVADGYQLWSQRYDRDMEDVFAIQDEIAQNIVKRYASYSVTTKSARSRKLRPSTSKRTTATFAADNSSISSASRASSSRGRCSTRRSKSIRLMRSRTPASLIAAPFSTQTSTRAMPISQTPTLQVVAHSSSHRSSRKLTLRAG